MLNIGIIGCGYWGPNLVRNFSSLTNCRVKTVSDLKSGRLDFIAREFPLIHTTNNYKEIINDTTIEAVVVATPVPTHMAIAVEAILAGKHVFVEKPMTASSSEADELVRTAKSQNKKLAVGHVFQFAPAVRRIKTLIQEGVIGDVLHVTSTRINLGPPDSLVDVIWDLGPHDFSIILFLLDQQPEKITSLRKSYAFNVSDSANVSKITNNAHIDLLFKNDVSAHIHLSWLSSNKTRLMQIFGSRGTIVYDEMLALDGKVKLYGTGVDDRIKKKDSDSGALKYQTGEIHIVELEQHEPLRMECEHFVNSVLEGSELVNNGDIGLDVVRLLEAASKF